MTVTVMTMSLPIPAGTYPVRVEAAEHRTSPSGVDFVRIHLLVEEPEHAGRLMWDSLVPQGTGMSRWVNAMRALGVDHERFTGMMTTDQVCALVADLVVGRQVLVRVRSRTWEGRVLPEVRSYL